MTHGGARAGAGRKRSPRDTKTVSWRLSSYAREWITHQAEEQGVTSGEIIDILIQSFEGQAENGEIDGFEAVSMIERRHKEIGTCRGCLHYENHCPFIAEQNKRGKLGCYPNRVCGDYKNREEQ